VRTSAPTRPPSDSPTPGRRPDARVVVGHHRAVIALVDLDGLSYQEAADVIGVPVGTVMSRLHRARRKVRDQLERSGFLEGER
jgi:predicted DNA-binding protein (UPF0251 family)